MLDALRMRAIAILVAIAAIYGALWSLQHPSPSPSQTSSPPQTQPQSGQESTTNEPHGTERAPFIVRSIKSKEDAAQDARDREDKASTDRWMLVFSGAVAIGAFLQVATFVVMISTSRRQLRAYVLPDGGSIKLIMVPWGERKEERAFIEALVAIKNFGVTPAKKFSAWEHKEQGRCCA
jgi:hypothetical protein